MISENKYAIELLVQEGEVILYVADMIGNEDFYKVIRFHESQFNSSASIDFNTLDGINITDFFEKYCVSSSIIRSEIMSKFNDFISNKKPMKLKFSKNHIWRKFE